MLTPITEHSLARQGLRAGMLKGTFYTVIFRPVGSTRAVVRVAGALFTIDDSSRLVRAGLRQAGGRGRSTLFINGKAATGREVLDYYNQYEQLGVEDFPKENERGID